MFAVSLKPKLPWHLSYRMKRMKLHQNLTTRKKQYSNIQKQFASAFTKKTNAEVPVLDKKTEVNLPNINITEEMTRNEILQLNANKSYKPDKIHPKFQWS